MRYSGYRQIKAGLQSNVYVESLLIEKQKLGYNDVGAGALAEASVRYVFEVCVCVCVCVCGGGGEGVCVRVYVCMYALILSG